MTVQAQVEHTHAVVDLANCSRWLTSGLATSDSEVRGNRNSVGNITAWCVLCDVRVRERDKDARRFFWTSAGAGHCHGMLRNPSRFVSYCDTKGFKNSVPLGQGSRFAPRHRHGTLQHR